MRILTLGTLLLLPLVVLSQATNDECVSAIPIACGDTIQGSTASALPDEALTCGTTITAPGVWYMLPGSNAAITVATCSNFSYDTKINVYQGTCGVITCVAGNDDMAGCGLGSSVSFTGNGGVTYYILVQGYNAQVGTFELTVECEVLPNDDCVGAIAMDCGDSISGTTIGAFPDEAFECGTSISAPGVWYTATGLAGVASVSTCGGASFDTKLNVYRGTCGVIECVAGNDDTPGQGLCSTVSWIADPTEIYQILVQGFDNAIGTFDLNLTCSTCPAPYNASVAALDTTAQVLWDSWNDGALYTVEFGPDGFTPGTGTMLAGVVGADGPPVAIGGLDVDTSYDVYIQEQCGKELSEPAGPISFTTLPVLLAPNATCATALPITCGDLLAGNTINGLNATGPTCASANISTKGLWYTLVGNGDVITLGTCGATNYDSKISVFTGTCGDFTCVAGNDDAPGCAGNSSILSFPSTPGTTYFVFVHGYNQAQGQFALSMTCAPSCSPVAANDECAVATEIGLTSPGSCKLITGSNACAFATAWPNPPCIPFAPIIDVWYQFNTGNATTITLQLEATTADLVHAALYTSCANAPYISCWTDVAGTIDLSGLAPNTIHYLRVWNGGGAQAGEFTLCLEGDLGTGLAADEQPVHITLHPVPTNDLLLVDGLHAPAELQVIDAIGRVVLTTRTSGGGAQVVQVGALASGTYLLRDARTGSLLGRFVRE